MTFPVFVAPNAANQDAKNWVKDEDKRVDKTKAVKAVAFKSDWSRFSVRAANCYNIMVEVQYEGEDTEPDRLWIAVNIRTGLFFPLGEENDLDANDQPKVC